MRQRGLVVVIVVAAGVVHQVAKARLPGGGPGRERTVVVIHEETAVARGEMEGEMEGVLQQSFRQTRFRTSRLNSRSAGCAGGGLPRRRWRDIRVPAKRCSRRSERCGSVSL